MTCPGSWAGSLLALSLLAASCSPQATLTGPAQPRESASIGWSDAYSVTEVPSQPPAKLATPTATAATTAEPIQAIAWVDVPEPLPGETILISGSLIKGGLYLGGLWMTFTWPQNGRIETFASLVSYGRGRCPIVVHGFAPGQRVPVTISVEYQGRRFTAETEFAPR